MAFPDSLNTGALPCSLKHQRCLVLLEDKQTLWDTYGIVDDATVSHYSLNLNVMLFTLVQPFTDGFPCMDIYELLTSDLLYQVIKGTFKDHLVTWVEEYLVLVHSLGLPKFSPKPRFEP